MTSIYLPYPTFLFYFIFRCVACILLTTLVTFVSVKYETYSQEEQNEWTTAGLLVSIL